MCVFVQVHIYIYIYSGTGKFNIFSKRPTDKDILFYFMVLRKNAVLFKNNLKILNVNYTLFTCKSSNVYKSFQSKVKKKFAICRNCLNMFAACHISWHSSHVCIYVSHDQSFVFVLSCFWKCALYVLNLCWYIKPFHTFYFLGWFLELAAVKE